MSSSRNNEQLQVYNTMKKPPALAKKGKARGARNVTPPRAAGSLHPISREKEEDKPISCSQLVYISKLEVKERQSYVRFVLYFFFVLFFVRLGIDDLGKYDPAADAVQTWIGDAFSEVATYKEGVAWIDALRSKLYGEQPVPGTGIPTSSGELIPYTFGPIATFNLVVVASITRVRCGLEVNANGKLESTTFRNFRTRAVRDLLYMSSPPCLASFVTVDPNGTAWYIPETKSEGVAPIILLNDSSSMLYSQSCASVAIIGTTPQGDAQIAMQILRENNFFANDTCKLMARLVTENSVKPVGKEPSTCNTIAHWGLASSGASRSGMSSFCTHFKLSGLILSGGEKFLMFAFLVINIYYDVLEISEEMREMPDIGYFVAIMGSGRGFRYMSYLSATANMFIILYILSLGSSSGIPDLGTRYGVGASSAFQLWGESGVVALNSPLRLLMPLHALFPTAMNSITVTCFIGAGGLLGLIPRQSQLALVPNLLRWAVQEFLPLGLMMYLIILFYSALGYALFSRSGAYSFQTMDRSVATLFEMGFTEGPSLADLQDMIGINSDFVGPDSEDGNWHDMASYSIASTIWFTTFYIAFNCLLLNLFIAIACTAYDEMSAANRSNHTKVVWTDMFYWAMYWLRRNLIFIFEYGKGLGEYNEDALDPSFAYVTYQDLFEVCAWLFGDGDQPAVLNSTEDAAHQMRIRLEQAGIKRLTFDELRVILEDIIPGNESDSRVEQWTRDLEDMYGLRLLKELEVTAKATDAFRTKSVALVETRELGSSRLEGLSQASFKQHEQSMYKL